MAKIKKAAKQAVRRAKAAGAQARRQGGRMATRLARKTVKKAGKTVARVRGQAIAVATKVAGKITGRTRKRKRAKVVATVVGAAAAGSSRRRGCSQPPQAVERTFVAPALPLASAEDYAQNSAGLTDAGRSGNHLIDRTRERRAAPCVLRQYSNRPRFTHADVPCGYREVDTGLR